MIDPPKTPEFSSSKLATIQTFLSSKRKKLNSIFAQKETKRKYREGKSHQTKSVDEITIQHTNKQTILIEQSNFHVSTFCLCFAYFSLSGRMTS
jgi:hypothetical protein